MPINNVEEISLIVPHGKIEYLLRNKIKWLNAMGYYENDYEKFVQILLQ